MNPNEPFVRPFSLYRHHDVSGLSGEGIVADGAVFPSGKAIMEWRGGEQGLTSVATYPDVATLIAIHGHNGSTEIHWHNDSEPATA